MKTIVRTNVNTKVALLLAIAGSATICPAQTLVSSVFGGNNGINNTTINASAILGGDTETDSSIGPGWNGEVSIGLGVVYNVTLGINEGDTGAFRITGGGVAGVASTFQASKTFSGGELGMTIVPDQLYAVDLTVSNAAALSLLSSYNVGIQVGGVGVNNGANTGLLGLADVLSLFGGTDSATLFFTTPGSISSQDLTFSTAGGTTAGLLGNTFTINGATIRQVPEPSGLFLCSIGGLIAFRRRR